MTKINWEFWNLLDNALHWENWEIHDQVDMVWNSILG